jgi:ABC-2 type transport system ATP-binding protein
MTMKGSLHGLGGSVLKQRAGESLERFGLAEAAGRVVRGYSGGMQRRLDIAMGLIHSPRVLFLDEPTTGLDPEVRAVMWDEIARLVAEGGITILLTTHYLEEADRLASELAIIDRGRVVLRGTPEGLKRGLRGDTLHLDLSATASQGQVGAILEHVSGVTEVKVDGCSIRARADDGARAIAEVLAALKEAGLAVASATVARPTLDDVYLRHAGRPLDADGIAGKDDAAAG